MYKVIDYWVVQKEVLLLYAGVISDCKERIAKKSTIMSRHNSPCLLQWFHMGTQWVVYHLEMSYNMSNTSSATISFMEETHPMEHVSAMEHIPKISNSQLYRYITMESIGPHHNEMSEEGIQPVIFLQSSEFDELVLFKKKYILDLSGLVPYDRKKSNCFGISCNEIGEGTIQEDEMTYIHWVCQLVVRHNIIPPSKYLNYSILYTVNWLTDLMHSSRGWKCKETMHNIHIAWQIISLGISIQYIVYRTREWRRHDLNGYAQKIHSLSQMMKHAPREWHIVLM